jgi:hypothetical protein
LHDGELHNLYSSLVVIRQEVYRVLVGKHEGKRPLERPRRRWEDGIKMAGGVVEWIHLAQDRGRWWVLEMR